MSYKHSLALIGSFCLIVALVAAPFGAAYAKSEKKSKLSYAYYGPSVGAPADCFRWWVNELEERTGGLVTAKIYWGGTLARAMEMAEAVRTGTADLGDTVWAPYNPEKFVLATIGDFPVGFLDTPLAEWLAAERLAKEFPEFDKELAANNMKRLTYYGVGNIHLISRKPIRKLEDLKGLKVRCSGKLHPVQLKAVGAVPIFIPSVEAYDGLQKGVIDASTCTARWAVSYKYYETPAKYFIRIGLGGDPGMGVMINSGVWNKLPQSAQQVLLELRQEFPPVYEEAIYKETVEKSYKVLKEAGVEFIDFPKADLETWKKLPVLKEQAEKWMDFVVKARGLSRSRVKEILDRYKELVKEFAQKYPRKF